MTREEPSLTTFHRLIIIGTAVAVVFGLGIPFAVVFLNARQAVESQLEVTCAIVEAEIAQLKAVMDNRRVLYQIRRELGLPRRVPIPLKLPVMPPECETLSSSPSSSSRASP